MSFICLKGRCRFCQEAISWQYPLIEITTSFLFWFSALNAHGNPLSLLADFCFVSFLILLVVSDLKWKLLPHPFTNFFALAGLFFQGVSESFDIHYLYLVAAGFVVVGAFVFILVQVFPGVLGGGDIKMILALSLWLGVVKSAYALVLAFGMGAVIALILLWLKKVNRRTQMPFGPFLAFGAFGFWFFPQLLGDLRNIL